MDKQKIVITDDNSTTVFSDRYKEHYHSTFGAENESQHIFIDAGLKQINKQEISIFEMGFGTGLNAYLTLKNLKEENKKVHYLGIEKHPVLAEVYENLSFSSDKIFLEMHTLAWGKEFLFRDNFVLEKVEADLLDYQHKQKYDLVYFDAFSPDIQSDLWSEDVFKKLYNTMNNGAVLMTYSVKGIVKRALKSAGFKIEKLPGPKGKREILRATKVI